LQRQLLNCTQCLISACDLTYSDRDAKIASQCGTYCNTLQSSATHCNTLISSGVTILLSFMARYNTPPYIALLCNTLQHTAHCNTLQHHTATHCTTHSRCGNRSGSRSVTTVVSAHLPRPPPPPHHDSYSGHETPYQVCVCVCDVKDVY